MRAKRLFISVGVALAILVGYNVLIAWRAHTSQRQRMRAKLEQLPAAADCVFLGNSLVEAGCDADAFASAWPRRDHAFLPINLALGATSPVEHYLILQRALRSPMHPRYLVYGFFDDQLNATVHGDWSDLVGNRALSYYFPDQAADFYAPGSWWKRLELGFTARVPMLAERSSLWTEVELLRRRFEDVGMPRQKTNRFGRVADFGALEAKDIASFNARCAAVVDGNVGFSRPIREIVQLARARGMQVIFVEMPMPSRHRQVFYSSPVWSRMRSYLQNLAAREGVTYVSAADWVNDDRNFEDATHLNEQGAKLFSGQLAAAISRLDRQFVELASR
jgi:hypothetical protein